MNTAPKRTPAKRKAGRVQHSVDKVLSPAVLLGRKGGKATLKKYGKKQLREWGKRGGRPRKVQADGRVLNPPQINICKMPEWAQ